MTSKQIFPLQLRPMSEKEFGSFLIESIRDYADDKIAAGSWPTKEALKKSEESFNSLLPQGLHSQDNYLYTIVRQETKVGRLWMAKLKEQPDTIFIYDFAIDKDFQNQGIGSQALQLADQQARKLSFKRIALHVFGQNARALHVYLKSGYGITDISMQKDL